MKLIRSKRFAIRAFIILYLVFPLSCSEDEACFDSCCGVDISPQFSEIESMELQIGSLNTFSDASYSFSETKTTQWDSALARIYVSDVSIFTLDVASQDQPRPHPFTHRAIACSPAQPLPNQQLVSISIYSDKELIVKDEKIPAGVDLSPFFEVKAEWYSDTPKSIPSFILAQNEDPYLFGSYYSSLLFQLKQFIEISDVTLTFRFAFDDEAMYEVVTSEFTILPD